MSMLRTATTKVVINDHIAICMDEVAALVNEETTIKVILKSGRTLQMPYEGDAWDALVENF